MLTVFTVTATSASMARFVVEDDSFGSADEIVRLKVLRNTRSGEKVEIVPALGGKTEALLLRTPRGDLREVLLDHHRNATAVHANVGWKGAMLVPYANRVANGTYTLDGVTYCLERNEVTPFQTWDPADPEGADPTARYLQDRGAFGKNALHGYLYRKPMAVLGASGGEDHATLSLGYDFDGTDAGYPFLLRVNVTYPRAG